MHGGWSPQNIRVLRVASLAAIRMDLRMLRTQATLPELSSPRAAQGLTGEVLGVGGGGVPPKLASAKLLAQIKANVSQDGEMKSKVTCSHRVSWGQNRASRSPTQAHSPSRPET